MPNGSDIKYQNRKLISNNILLFEKNDVATNMYLNLNPSSIANG